MKKILMSLLLVGALFSGCSSLPFKYEKPSTTATIYTYVVMPQSINEDISDPCYKIEINEKYLKSCMRIQEFMEFKNLKPQMITISATRDDIDKKTISLDLEAGKTYFLKVQSYSSILGQFNFTQVSRDEALQSITSMTMANPPKSKEKDVLDFFVSEEKNETNIQKSTVSVATSKMDEIQKANDMKEKGLLTQEEFEKLKAEILAK